MRLPVLQQHYCACSKKQILFVNQFLFICLLALVFPVAAQAQKTPLQIPLKNGVLQVEANTGISATTTELQRGRWGANYYALLVFQKQPTSAQLQRLRVAGAELLQRLPGNSYQVRFRTLPSLFVLREIGVQYTGQLAATYKISHGLQKELQTAPPQAPVLVSILLQKGEPVAAAQLALQKLGFRLTRDQYINQGLFIGTLSKQTMQAVAELPFVQFLNQGGFTSQPLMFRERGVFGLSFLSNLQGGGRNLTGQGITVGVGDNADPTSHIDLQKNVINRSPAPIGGSTHGTHVAGVVTGDGLVEERWTGTAPGILAVSDYFDYIISKSQIYTADYGMTVTNNSYYSGLQGCIGNGEYNELSVYADQQMIANPFLQHIFAGGNDGALTCSPYPSSFGTIKSGYQTSKNVLTVGNCDIFTPLSADPSSSRGPLTDGRIKPEIMASGTGVAATSINNAYTNNFGTSAAAPFVTGVWAMLTERYKQLHGGNPKSGLLKSILCNTATDKGNAGPDFSHGFGWVHPQRALLALEQNRYYTGSVAQGNFITQSISVPAGTKQVKVMLYWHDPAGTPFSSSALEHDLDLQVTDGSNNYRPWILNPAPAQVNVPAVRGIDRANNIEQVTIDNPGSSIQFRVDGFDIANGPQEFFVTWEFIDTDLKLLYPTGGERFTTIATAPGRLETISWEANDNSSNTFTLEYSLDNGSSWVLIANNVPATDFRYYWSVPTVFSATAKVRITRNGGGASATTPGNFTIMGIPTLTATVPCEGYVDLNWTAVPNVSDYQVFQLVNGELSPITTTTALTYRVSGLDRNTRYWFTVRPRIADSAGKRGTARSIIPALATPCSAAAFDNDLKIDTLLAPSNGRRFTGSALTATSPVTVRIKNLDNAATSGNYTLSYQVNGGAIVNEVSAATIAAGGTVTYTFATTADLSALTTYSIRVWVKRTGDLRTENDEKTYTIRHVDNQPIGLPFTEGFESTGTDEYRSFTFAVPNANQFDFTPGSSNGRLKTFINQSMAINGNRSVTLDALQNLATLTGNQLVGTFNLSNEATTPGLRLDFLYRNQGQLKLPPATVWLRGRDDLPWVQVLSLGNDQNELGNNKQAWVNINEVMTNAGQPITSSFQLRLDQQGKTSANNGSYTPDVFDLDDGFTMDDLRITAASNDLTITRILAPDSLNCNNGTVNIRIRIKNTSTAALTNVPVYYRLDNGTPVAEIVPTVAAAGETDYTFSTTANLTGNTAHELDVWVKEPGDTYAVNDSILNYRVYHSPVVTSYPYLQTFEADNGGFFTSTIYSSWVWGTTDAITRSTVNRAANGSKAWFTNLAGLYKPNEESYLYSPCFNLSSLTNPVLSFSHISRQEDNVDIHTLEYTTNNGATWQRLGVQNGGTNWFSSPGNTWANSLQRWHVSSVEIPTTASSVRFRFLFSSSEATQREGIGIDDFHIFERETVYSGSNVTNITQPVNGSGFVHFRSGGNLVASINPLGQNLGTGSASVYINTAPVRFINNQYYLDRNIVLSTSIAPTDSVLVRFYFTEQEAAALIGASGCGTCSSIRDAFVAGVTKFSGLPAIENGTLIDNIGNYLFLTPEQVSVVPYNNGYYAEFKVRDFSEFWINGGGLNFSQPLPVTLLNFRANGNFPDADLFWETASETNSSHFEVERSLNSDQQFTKIGSVTAAGQSDQKRSYRFTDAQALRLAGQVFYRLKMVDADGTFTYSNIVVVKGGDADLFIRRIAPNGGQLLVVTGYAPAVQDMRIRIFSTAGQTLLTQQLPYQTTQVNIQHLPAGTYFIEITDRSGSRNYKQKFTKQ